MRWLNSLLLTAVLSIQSVYASTESPCSLKKHPIIYLMATPCSGMVEVLRMMHERGDMTVMHIPANLAYCHEHNYVELVRGWYRDDAPTNYHQAAEEIDKMALISSVVVGENTHTALEFLDKNQAFADQPQMHYVFLIADPHPITLSYYEKKKDYFDQLPEEQMTHSIGFKGLYQFILSLKDKGHSVFICQSEDLYHQPEDTIRSMCEHVGIPYLPQALHWQDLSSHFSTFPFWTIENTSCSLAWHLDAIKSTSFTKPPQYALDSHGHPTFEEIVDSNHRRICRNAYEENKVYYDLIMHMSTEDLIKN